MKIAIIGAGFTGLTSGLRLSQKGHDVFIYEKAEDVGGLAVGFQEKGWKWTVEKAYHHWFTNDYSVLNLASELNHPVVIKRPKTDIFANNQILPLDSALSLIRFPYISLLSRIRTGMVLAFMKVTNNFHNFENKRALEWLEKWMGRQSVQTIWEPLFLGKFGEHKNLVILSWFWARIKKRTPSLAYPEGGFKSFADRIDREVIRNGGKIFLNTTIESIGSDTRGCFIRKEGRRINFDRIICTSPTPVFLKLTKFSKSYTNKLGSIKHLHALNLILISKKAFMKSSYWLSIADKTFPFLVLVDHTNFIDTKFYNKEHILYIGCYLNGDHPYLKMTKEQLLKSFDRYLAKINPDYKKNLLRVSKFIGPFAQPVVEKGYSKVIPKMKTPLKNVFLANLDMVYPWDRGTNYAVELGEEAAKMIE